MLTGYESGPGLPHFGRRLDVTVKIRRGDRPGRFRSCALRKPRSFPAGKDHGMKNHDAFLEERIMEWKTKTLSCRKGPWNEKPRRFLGGKDHGMGNQDAFLQERTMEWETMATCRSGLSGVWKECQYPIARRWNFVGIDRRSATYLTSEASGCTSITKSGR